MQSLSVKDRVTEAVAAVMPFQIRSRSFTAVVLRLSGAPGDEFFDALDRQLAQAPHFFSNAPVLIDLERADGPDGTDDFAFLSSELRRRKLSVFGIQNGSPEQSAAALDAGLITLTGGREVPHSRDRRDAKAAAKPDAAPAPEAVEPEPEFEPETILITEPVRSGQRIFADRGDLVVVASVSSGAELIAHGNVHIYGTMRGRALAGVNGNRNARIFCQDLKAELIAIAGLYRTSDDLGPETSGRRVQAFLKDETLCVEALK
ncbi:septum site-determining protein MinC [Amaricoccus macauensis]|uniref:septum site-determining protein MinC n=1 Tax=Amaricoccus macauensis TaxID=57001 RepID=UPI003C7E8DBF